jgi:hypothetical protein
MMKRKFMSKLYKIFILFSVLAVFSAACLQIIDANPATRMSLNDNESPYETTVQADLNIEDFVVSSGNPPKQVTNRSIWHVRCQVSHFAYDDPIVSPNQFGASHLHMFFGNTDANAFSTAESIRDTGSSTCDRDELNRTAYWTPALLDGDSKVIPSDTITVYYMSRNFGTEQEPYPPGLRMIAKPQPDENTDLYWKCGFFGAAFNESGNAGPEQASIPYCDPDVYSHIQTSIMFPRCWDGVNLDSEDHASHMAYATGYKQKDPCPSSHPVELPVIRTRIMYSLQGTTDSPTNEWFLSSDVNHDGTVATPHGATLHADWFGGWEPETNQLLLDTCIAQKLNCGEQDLGDGREVGRLGPRRYRGPGLPMEDFLSLCLAEDTLSDITDIANCGD